MTFINNEEVNRDNRRKERGRRSLEGDAASKNQGGGSGQGMHA